ncbi:MAG TPA: epoxide hydrolase [Steroidobacteraceae bacterium]|jgi:microsomal epoxide hydrolase
MTPIPFRISFSDLALRDLRERLKRVRWPDEAPGPPWSTGTSVSYMKELVAYWYDHFDWRAQEAKLNSFHHFTVPIGGIDLHFIHEQGKGSNPMPLLLSHGWPGSIFEFYKIIPMLIDPVRFGGNPVDAFTIIAPSLPGYAFSFQPGQARFGIEGIADVFAQLMTHVLGYARFAAQGGDWGAFIASRLGMVYPERLYGIHLNMLAVRRDPAIVADPTPEEDVFLDQVKYWLKEEMGYIGIQGTKPQTLAFGMSDSPAGLAAWIIEKFRAWSDSNGNVEQSFTKDELLTNITIYWLTGAIGSAFWPYYSRLHSSWPIPEGACQQIPVGYAEFPAEMLRPPRSIAEKVYDIRRWTKMAKGGHFAALEQPEALVHEIREFFRPLRGI